MSRDGFICDAQVHAPRVDPVGPVNGIDERELLGEMQAASVDRAIIVPVATKTNVADNGPAIQIAQRHPGQFRVMGLINLERQAEAREELANWQYVPEMIGLRVSCAREPNRSMLLGDELDWLWTATEARQIPVSLFCPTLVYKALVIAEHHPGLRITVDHLGLRSDVVYSDLIEAVEALLPLASYPNVAVKATSLPSSVPGPYPYRAAHEGMRMVVEAFGAPRVFWGSDITRLPCSYRQCVTMFTEELPFLTKAHKDLIMGRALCEWLGWLVV